MVLGFQVTAQSKQKQFVGCWLHQRISGYMDDQWHHVGPLFPGYLINSLIVDTATVQARRTRLA